MQAACMLYRANRLAPLVMYMRDTCRALGPSLRQLVGEFWAAYPETDVHFFVEADRFSRILRGESHSGPAASARGCATFVP